jgi:hypothetical protein
MAFICVTKLSEDERQTGNQNAVAVTLDGLSLRNAVDRLNARGICLRDVEGLHVSDSLDVRSVTDVDLGVIATFVNLRVLTLHSLSRIHSLDPLRWFKKLVAVDISECHNITSFEPLQAIKSLQEITFTATPRTAPGLNIGLDCFEIEEC